MVRERGIGTNVSNRFVDNACINGGAGIGGGFGKDRRCVNTFRTMNTNSRFTIEGYSFFTQKENLKTQLHLYEANDSLEPYC